MGNGKINSSAATLSKNRTEESIVPASGLCTTCVDGCIGMCEVGKSAYRGAEMLYPKPYGIITTAGQKNYSPDLSDFTILGSCRGAYGIEAESDKAVFTKVNLEKKIGRDKKLKTKLPIIIPGLGSTDVAKNNWDGLAIGAAISGIIMTVGENVGGMDPNSKIENGKITYSEDLERRVKLYKDWQQNGYGGIVIQANVEDTTLGVQEYALKKLGAEIVELKWGQGAKDIGGEVKLKTLQKAQELASRGYIVLPNPFDPVVIAAYENHVIDEFERHSRMGMVTKEGFFNRIDELRKAGAKHIFLKTGAYRPSDLALAVKYASEAQLDLLTVDAAGGGTGMSPWRMMNEWGVPRIELWSLLYRSLDYLHKKGKYIPDVAVASGISMEDQIFKALALGAPYFSMVGMARAPLAAAMVGKTIGNSLLNGETPVYISRFGRTKDEVFISAPELKKSYGKRFDSIPTGAIGLYTYMKRLEQGLKQLMAGARKFSTELITRNDIASLSEDATKVSGIQYIMETDKEEIEKILNQ